MGTYKLINRRYEKQKRSPLPSSFEFGGKTYVLKSQIGRGAFSTVFSAEVDGTAVAMKITKNSYSYYNVTETETVVAQMLMQWGSDTLRSNFIAEPLAA